MRKPRIIALCCLLVSVTAAEPHHHRDLKSSKSRHHHKHAKGHVLAEHGKEPSNQKDHAKAYGHAEAGLIQGALTAGRYGHSTVYLPHTHRILFIGGQVGEGSRYITNDVLSLDLDKPAPSAKNPVAANALTKGLPPHAWAAAGVDDRNQVWLIGGVTEDCSTDPLALTLCPEKQAWKTAPALPVAPPRRRQAAALALPNPKGNRTTDLYVWGGIAEPYTCSPKTVGYMGMDIWSTGERGTVSTKPFVLPKRIRQGYQPPVSDYAVVSWAEGQVVILGGQLADGTLASFCEILVYLSKTNEWIVKNANTTGVCPTSRMGHVAFRISDTQLLIHGGVGTSDLANGDMWLLDGAPEGKWGWSRPAIHEKSIASPHRAWHSATWINDKRIVLAYGIDTQSSKTSGDIFFLSREKDNSWMWSNKWEPPARKPAASRSAHSSAAAKSTAPPEVGFGYNNGVTALAVPSSIVDWASDSATATAAAAENQSNAQSSGTTGKAVGGAIGGVFGAAALAGLIGLYLRRKNVKPNDPVTGNPVSSMHFSRPPPMRVLSLGKSMQPSSRSPLASRVAAPAQMRQTVDQGELLDFLYPGTKSNRSSETSQPADPFSDRYAHDSEVEDASEAGAVPPSVSASVQSYPYLTALPMSSNRTDSGGSSASTINANSRTALGLGRPGARVDEDGLTRLPSQSRHFSAPRAASSPVGPPRRLATAVTPASPYVINGPAGLLRVTNPPDGGPPSTRYMI